MTDNREGKLREEYLLAKAHAESLDRLLASEPLLKYLSARLILCLSKAILRLACWIAPWIADAPERPRVSAKIWGL